MTKRFSVKVFALFTDFIGLIRKRIDQYYAEENSMPANLNEIIDLLNISDQTRVEYSNLIERALNVTPYVSRKFLLSPDWWQDQGIDFDYWSKIIP